MNDSIEKIMHPLLTEGETSIPPFICKDWKVVYDIPNLWNIDIENKSYTEYGIRPYVTEYNKAQGIEKEKEILAASSIKILLSNASETRDTEVEKKYERTLTFLFENAHAIEQSILQQALRATFEDTRPVNGLGKYFTAFKQVIERDTGKSAGTHEEFVRNLFRLKSIYLKNTATRFDNRSICIFEFDTYNEEESAEAFVYNASCLDLCIANPQYYEEGETLYNELIHNLAEKNNFVE